MPIEVEMKIAELPTHNKAQLLPIWAELSPDSPPTTLRKELMVPILPYPIQEKVCGGLMIETFAKRASDREADRLRRALCEQHTISSGRRVTGPIIRSALR